MRAFLKMYGSDEAKKLLLDYYGKSAEGQDEKRRSPHRDRPLDEFVKAVLDDVKEEV